MSSSPAAPTLTRPPGLGFTSWPGELAHGRLSSRACPPRCLVVSRTPRAPGGKSRPCSRPGPSCRRSARAGEAGHQPLGLGVPHVALSLNHRNPRAGVRRRQRSPSACPGQRRVPGAVRVLGDESQEECGHFIAHPRSCAENPSRRAYAREASASTAFVRPADLRPSAHGSARATTRADSQRRRSVEVARCPSAALRRFRFPRF